MTPEQTKEAIRRVFLSGMRLMFDPKTFKSFRAGVTRKAPLDDILAVETAGLMSMLYDRSKKTIPLEIIPKAATMLLGEMGKFITQAGIAEVDDRTGKSAIVKLMAILKKMYGKRAAQQPEQAPQQGVPPPEQAPQQGMPPEQSMPQPVPQPAGLIGA